MVNACDPIQLEPILHPKNWGGRKLSSILRRHLPTDGRFGESWEISGLPNNISTIVSGPFAGQTLDGLIRQAPTALLGTTVPEAWRSVFPLLIKFLDANENLSIQVHPKPPAANLKDEAWYILDADDGANVYIGLRPDCDLARFTRAVRSGDDLLPCLNAYPARRGGCFSLPSGVVHALGSGILVAEVQTPSDTTYRLHDWHRIDPATHAPRALHIEQGLANLRDDVSETDIIQPRELIESTDSARHRVCSNGSFIIDELSFDSADHELPLNDDVFQVLIVVDGDGGMSTTDGAERSLRLGDVLLVPAACRSLQLHADKPLKVLLAAPVTG